MASLSLPAKLHYGRYLGPNDGLPMDTSYELVMNSLSASYFAKSALARSMAQDGHGTHWINCRSVQVTVESREQPDPPHRSSTASESRPACHPTLSLPWF